MTFTTFMIDQDDVMIKVCNKKMELFMHMLTKFQKVMIVGLQVHMPQMHLLYIFCTFSKNVYTIKAYAYCMCSHMVTLNNLHF